MVEWWYSSQSKVKRQYYLILIWKQSPAVEEGGSQLSTALGCV